MMNPDVERILAVLNNLKDETSKQIEALSYVSDYRLNTIPHTHNVHVNGSHSPSANGSHGHGDGSHIHGMDIQLQGASPTDGIGIPNKVSTPLTWPGDYSDDKHGHHPHTDSSNVYEEQHPESAATYTSSIIAIGNDLQQDLTKMKCLEDELYCKKECFNNGYGSPWKEIYILKEKIDIVKKYAANFPMLQWIGEKHTLLQLMQIVLTYTVDAKWAVITYHDFQSRGYDKKYNDNKATTCWDSLEYGKTNGNINQDVIGNVMVALKSSDPF